MSLEQSHTITSLFWRTIQTGAMATRNRNSAWINLKLFKSWYDWLVHVISKSLWSLIFRWWTGQKANCPPFNCQIQMLLLGLSLDKDPVMIEILFTWNKKHTLTVIFSPFRSLKWTNWHLFFLSSPDSNVWHSTTIKALLLSVEKGPIPYWVVIFCTSVLVVYSLLFGIICIPE